MSARFESRVERVDRCGDDVLLISLMKPIDYAFKAGQWFRLYLPTAEGEQARTFSHASEPQDPDLLLATRLSRSAFKRALASLTEGDTLEISAPGGRLALPEPVSGLLVLTGGVGVAPIRSLLREAKTHGRRFEDAVMFYGVRDDACIPFRDELERLSEIGIQLVVVCEHPGDGWEGERGLITPVMVRRHIGNRTNRSTVVTGPPAMVHAMERLLDELGIPDELRIIERFGAAHVVR